MILGFHYLHYGFNQIDKFGIILFLSLGIAFLLIGSFIPVQRRPAQRVNYLFLFFRKNKIPSPQHILILLAIIPLTLLFLTSALKKSLFLILPLYIAIPFGFLTAPVASISMPFYSYKKWRNFCLSAMAVIITLYFSTEFGLLYAGAPDSVLTKISFSILGDFPLPISQSRLMSLAVIPNGAESTLFEKLNPETIVQFSQDEWIRRTKACQKNSCFDVSDILIPTNLDVPIKVERFYLLLGGCAPEVNKDGALHCNGAHLTAGRINSWLTYLTNTNVARAWLSDPAPLKQYSAVVSLMCKPIDTVTEGTIHKLQLSENAAVKAVANIYFSLYAPDASSQFKPVCNGLNRGRYF